MRTIKAASVVIFAVVVLVFLAGPCVEAAGQSLEFHGSDSGTGVSVPLDLDVDSCTTAGGATICMDISFYNNTAGKQSGGIEAGQFTAQGVSETDPVAGTGCLLAPAAIKSCTLGSVTNACEFQFVGGNTAMRYKSMGDILTLKLTSGTVCIDVSNGTGTSIQLPFNFAGSESSTITGGSGNFTGATGTLTSHFTGQELGADLQGHGFSWSQESFDGTITKP